MIEPVKTPISPLQTGSAKQEKTREKEIFNGALKPQDIQGKQIQEAHAVGLTFSGFLQVIVDKIKNLFSCLFPKVEAQKAVVARKEEGPRPLKSGEGTHTSTVLLEEFLYQTPFDVAARECASRMVKENPKLQDKRQVNGDPILQEKQKILNGLPLLVDGIQTRSKKILGQIKKSTFLDPATKRELILAFENFIVSPAKLKGCLLADNTASNDFAKKYKKVIGETTKFLDGLEAFLKKQQPPSEKFMGEVWAQTNKNEQISFAHTRELFPQPRAALIQQYQEAKAKNSKLSLEEFLETEYNKPYPDQYGLDYPRDYFEIGTSLVGGDRATIEKGNEAWMVFLRSCWKKADPVFLHIMRYQMQTIFTQMLFGKETTRMFGEYAAKGYPASQLSFEERKAAFPTSPDTHPILCTFHARKEGNTVVLECMRPFKIGRPEDPRIPLGYDAVRISVRIDLSKKLDPTNPLATPGAVTVREQSHGFRKTLGAIHF
jgi:hypothetical protein